MMSALPPKADMDHDGRDAVAEDVIRSVELIVQPDALLRRPQ